MKKYTYQWVVVLLFVVSKPILAQITIAQTDVASAGTQVIMQNHNYTDTIGRSGSNRLWDFSMLSGGSLDTLRFLLPSQTPYSTSFPQSNLVLKQSDPNFIFFTSNATSLSVNGTYNSLGSTTLDSVLPIPITIPAALRLSPPLAYIRFPASYNSAFTSNSAARITVPFSTSIPNPTGSGTLQVDSIRLVTAIEANSLIDGWGTLRLSAGRQDPALRQRTITRTTITVELRARIPLPFGGIVPLWVPLPQALPVDQQITINYWAQNKKYPMLQFDLDSAGTQVLNASSQFAVGTYAHKPSPAPKLNIWPNPLSGLALYIGAGGACTVSLYSSSGALVSQSKQLASASTRTIDVPVLAAGVYLVRISGHGYNVPQISTLTIKNQSR